MSVASFMPILMAQSWRYVSRSIWSLTSDMLLMMELMASERFSGSRSFFSIRSVLNSMKSVWCSSIYLRKSAAVCLRAKLSGSSPSGRSSTFRFMPSASSMSVPRMAACMPAASPS